VLLGEAVAAVVVVVIVGVVVGAVVLVVVGSHNRGYCFPFPSTLEQAHCQQVFAKFL